jgi:hypothetical protein
MVPVKIAGSEMPLDDLVARVYHLELSKCRNAAEFKEGLRLALRNVEEVLDALASYRPEGKRAQRAAEQVKYRAINVRKICAAVPETFDTPDGWRGAAEQVIANYEQFRIEAGLLYKIAAPEASFAVLRAAL